MTRPVNDLSLRSIPTTCLRCFMVMYPALNKFTSNDNGFLKHVDLCFDCSMKLKDIIENRTHEIIDDFIHRRDLK